MPAGILANQVPRGYPGGREHSHGVQPTDCPGKSLKHCLMMPPPLSFTPGHSISLHIFIIVSFCFLYIFLPHFSLSSLLFLLLTYYAHTQRVLAVSKLPSLQTFRLFIQFVMWCHLSRLNQLAEWLDFKHHQCNHYMYKWSIVISN